MFNKYKELEYRINDLQKANDKFRDELYELKNTVKDHYKFKVLYKPSWFFMFKPTVTEKAIEFVKDNLSNKDEPIILDLKTGKAVDFIQLKEKK